MKINYICHFDPTRHQGGGEMVMADVLRAGESRGHRFRITAVRPEPRQEYLEDADLDLLADVFNFPSTLRSRGAWRTLPGGVLDRCLERGRFVHLSTAYADVCNLPYMPCSGESAPTCPHKSRGHLLRNLAARDFGSSCFATRQFVSRLFEASLLNVFLSPLHRDVCQRVLGLDPGRPAFVLKPTVDGTVFLDRGLERDIEYLFVGVICEAKGLEQLRRDYRGRDIHLAGKVHPDATLDFGTYHGALPYAEIPALMNRARNFVFLPRWPEPQGRVVVEAALCGCKLITNDRVGATSFPFDIGDISNFRDPTGEFWDRIEGIAP